jgi:hypothetical protein
MLDRYRAALALTSLLSLGAAPGHHRHPPRHSRPNLAAPSAGIALYSRRALRRAKIILQLRLLELHEEELDRVRRAVERHLPIDLPTPSSRKAAPGGP